MSVLIDSDILIEVSRGKDSSLVSRWAELMESDTAILFSPVNAAELWAGARPNEYDILNHLFSSLTCVPTDADVGRQAGNYMRLFRKSHGVELGDALIAASAAASNAMLWTRNRKHYPMEEIRFFE
jgi:predicted nucleic acid-binding protein